MNNPIKTNNISPDVMLQFADDALVTATNVYESIISNQNNVYTIHGPASEHLSKEFLPHVNNISQNNELYIGTGCVVHIHPPQFKTSIVLSGLKDNTIIIHGKLNHVLIRKSENITLEIKEGTISGVDIIHCRYMLIKMPYHNFTNLEFVEGIYFQAEVNDISQLHITGSLDVKVNNITIPINPFINAIFTNKDCTFKTQHEFPDLTIYNF